MPGIHESDAKDISRLSFFSHRNPHLLLAEFTISLGPLGPFLSPFLWENHHISHTRCGWWKKWPMICMLCVYILLYIWLVVLTLPLFSKSWSEFVSWEYEDLPTEWMESHVIHSCSSHHQHPPTIHPLMANPSDHGEVKTGSKLETPLETDIAKLANITPMSLRFKICITFYDSIYIYIYYCIYNYIVFMGLVFQRNITGGGTQMH